MRFRWEEAKVEMGEDLMVIKDQDKVVTETQTLINNLTRIPARTTMVMGTANLGETLEVSTNQEGVLMVEGIKEGVIKVEEATQVNLLEIMPSKRTAPLSSRCV